MKHGGCVSAREMMTLLQEDDRLRITSGDAIKGHTYICRCSGEQAIINTIYRSLLSLVVKGQAEKITGGRVHVFTARS